MKIPLVLASNFLVVALLNGADPNEASASGNAAPPSVSTEVDAVRKAVFEKGATYFLSCTSPTPVQTHRTEGNAAGFGNNVGKAVFLSFPSLPISFQCDANPAKPSGAFCARLILQVTNSRTRLRFTHKPVISPVLTLNNGKFNINLNVWEAMNQQGNAIAFVSLIPASDEKNTNAKQISNTVQVPVIVTAPKR